MAFFFFVKIMVEQLKTWTRDSLTVPKWVLIVRPKIYQMPPNLSAQAQKFWISIKKASLGVHSQYFISENVPSMNYTPKVI